VTVDVYRLDTPAEEIIQTFDAIGACMDAAPWYKKYEGKITLDMIEGCPDEAWIAWAIYRLGAKMDEGTRRVMLSKVRNPMLAFQLYLRLRFLTDEDDRLLERAFKGKLPKAEEELRTGVIRRAKRVGH
jgi:hypothetical protein